MRMASNQPSVFASWKKWSAIQSISRCHSCVAALASCAGALSPASRYPGQRRSSSCTTSGGGSDPRSSACRAQRGLWAAQILKPPAPPGNAYTGDRAGWGEFHRALDLLIYNHKLATTDYKHPSGRGGQFMAVVSENGGLGSPNWPRPKLPSSQIAEPALIRHRAMAQQLCEHAQSLVGEILVDERFLSADGLSRAELWRLRMPSVFLPSSSVKTM